MTEKTRTTQQINHNPTRQAGIISKELELTLDGELLQRVAADVMADVMARMSAKNSCTWDFYENEGDKDLTFSSKVDLKLYARYACDAAEALLAEFNKRWG